MGIKLKNIGLIGLGMIAGVAGSMQFDAVAQRSAGSPLPPDRLTVRCEPAGTEAAPPSGRRNTGAMLA